MILDPLSPLNRKHQYLFHLLFVRVTVREQDFQQTRKSLVDPIAIPCRNFGWEKGELTVRRQLTKKKGGGFELTSPKTKAGIRQISLGNNALDILREHREAQLMERQAVGENWQDQGLVFPSSIGTPIDRSNMRWLFKALLKDAGLPDIRFHDLRHTAASLMLNNGIPLIVVSRRLGHAQPSITLDVYGHLIPGKQQEAASLMDDLLTPIQFKLDN